MLGKAPACAAAWASVAALSWRTYASISPSELVPDCAYDCAREGLCHAARIVTHKDEACHLSQKLALLHAFIH
jgi:hypothetical protein